MISLKNVSLNYPNTSVPALKNITLEIQSGECILLTGHSGCGKSSLLRLLSGIVPHVYDGQIKGNITVEGLEPSKVQAYKIGEKVGMIYQNPRMQFFCTTARDEMAFARENAGDEPSKIFDDIAFYSNELNITSLWGKNLFKLSSGERQRVAIATVLTDCVKVILFDEPTSNLDKDGIRQLRELLVQLKKNNITIIIAEHRLGFLRYLVNRVIRIDSGQVAENIDAKTFWQYSTLQLEKYGLRHEENLPLPKAPLQSTDGLTCELKDKSVFHFPRGKVTVLLGANGSGKTTLLRALAGIGKLPCKVCLDNRILKSKTRQKMSFLVLQDLHQQLFTTSVTDEIMLSRRSVNDQDIKRLNHYIDIFGLTTLREKHPQALSGGEQQRVVIAAALFADREICLFDEPTSGLDGTNSKRLCNEMRKLAAAGRIVIIATHDPALAEQADFAHTLHYPC